MVVFSYINNNDTHIPIQILALATSMCNNLYADYLQDMTLEDQKNVWLSNTAIVNIYKTHQNTVRS
jgi:hypothetical protein